MLLCLCFRVHSAGSQKPLKALYLPLWGYDTTFKIGSDVIITFDNNHTDTVIYDDKVIDVKQAH